MITNNRNIDTIFYFAPTFAEYNSYQNGNEIDPRTIVFVAETGEIYKNGRLYGKMSKEDFAEMLRTLLAEHPEYLPIATKYTDDPKHIGAIMAGKFFDITLPQGILNFDVDEFFNDNGVKDSLIDIIKVYFNNNPQDLPVADANTLGVIKVGDGLVMKLDNGNRHTKLSIDDSYINHLISVYDFNQIISNIISSTKASKDDYGVVKISSLPGNMITVDNGVIDVSEQAIRNIITGYGYITNANLTVPYATDSILGGFYTGYVQNGKNYPIQLDSNHRAFVNVPWEASTPGGGGGNGSNSGSQKMYFLNVAHGTIPVAPVIGDYVSSSNSFVDNTHNNTWTYNNTNPSNGQDTYAIWAWFVNNNPISILGPIKIYDSVTGGSNGADTENIEWIYTRTTQKFVDAALGQMETALAQYSSTDKVTTDVTINGVVWKNHPQGIDTTYRYEYAAYRVVGAAAFTGPILWSAYGEKGTDGDGIEYIFYKGTATPTGINDPSSWTISQQDEYIEQGSDWVDDIDDAPMLPGEKVWVSIRKKHDGQWEAYSSPVVWAIYPLLSGIVTAYQIDPISTTIQKSSTEVSGSVTFKVTKLEGSSRVLMSSTDVSSIGSLSLEYGSTSTVTVNPTYNAVDGTWSASIPASTTYNNPAAAIYLYDNDTTPNILASAIIPVIQDATASSVQPLNAIVTRVSFFNEYGYGGDQNTAGTRYNDGTVVEDNGIRYIDIVIHNGSAYYCADEHLANTTPRSISSGWTQATYSLAEYIHVLVSDAAFIQDLTVNNIILVDDDIANNTTKIVGGMTSGNAIPRQLSGVTDNDVRIWAGEFTNADLSTAPFTVMNDGSFKANNANIKGSVKATSLEVLAPNSNNTSIEFTVVTSAMKDSTDATHYMQGIDEAGLNVGDPVAILYTYPGGVKTATYFFDFAPVNPGNFAADYVNAYTITKAQSGASINIQASSQELYLVTSSGDLQGKIVTRAHSNAPLANISGLYEKLSNNIYTAFIKSGNDFIPTSVAVYRQFNIVDGVKVIPEQGQRNIYILENGAMGTVYPYVPEISTSVISTSSIQGMSTTPWIDPLDGTAATQYNDIYCIMTSSDGNPRSSYSIGVMLGNPSGISQSQNTAGAYIENVIIQ